MGACGSKEQIMAQASNLATQAKTLASQGFSEMSELAVAYNPLESKGDPNSRCCLMLKEATELTAKVKTMEREWKEFANEAKGALDSSRTALESPVPTVHTQSLAAGATTTPSAEVLGGPGFRGDGIEAAKVKLEEAMQAGVYGKMQEWIVTLKELGQKQRGVNKLWAEAQAKKKAVDGAAMEIEKLKARAANGDHDAAGKMPYAERELAEKQAALKASQDAHDAEEGQQFERLRAALGQAPTLRSHVAAALDSVAAAMQTARASITGPISASTLPVAVGGTPAAAMPAGKPAPAVPLSVPGMAAEQ